MEPAHYTSLLPNLFRHKTTRVRVLKPEAILLDFHGTVSERHWEDKVIYPYVKSAVVGYLHENWTNETIQRCLPGLKNESFEQRFRHKYDNAPIIEDITTDQEEIESTQLINQIGDFLLWQMTTRRETKETQIIGRLVWKDGFERGKILTPLYDDVMPCIKSWVEQHSCTIHIISSVDNETLKLLFKNTEFGDLNKYISSYLSSKKPGEKIISDTYKKFYEKILRDSRPKSPNQINLMLSNRDISSCHLSKSSSNSFKSPSVSSPPSSTDSIGNLAKTILFITDSGQEAKAADQVANGNAFECLLIRRPGNKKIRTYYLSQFQYIDKFEDIEFI